MAEYINRIAAIRAIIAREFHDCGKCERAKEGSGDDYCFNEGLLNAVDAVQDLPAADVAEVRHSKWIDTSTKRECPLCGTAWRWSDNEADRFRYCPGCGAKMGESEE